MRAWGVLLGLAVAACGSSSTNGDGTGGVGGEGGSGADSSSGAGGRASSGGESSDGGSQASDGGSLSEGGLGGDTSGGETSSGGASSGGTASGGSASGGQGTGGVPDGCEGWHYEKLEYGECLMVLGYAKVHQSCLVQSSHPADYCEEYPHNNSNIGPIEYWLLAKPGEELKVYRGTWNFQTNNCSADAENNCGT